MNFGLFIATGSFVAQLASMKFVPAGELKHSAVVCPVQQRLPLASTAIQIARDAPLPDLRNMPSHLAPTTNLPRVIQAAPAEIVAAVPLEPAARVFVVDPSLLAPDRERLRRVYTEKVERWVALIGR